jgi:CBS domain-containing protein
MTTAKDIMTDNPIVVTADTEIAYAARLLLEKGINGLPVVDDKGRLIGIICQSDLISQQKKIRIPSVFTLLDGLIPLTSMRRFEKEVQKISATTVAHVMTPNPVSVTKDASIEELAGLMVDRNYHTLPVVEGEKLVGVIGKEDILKTLIPR